MFCGRLIQTNTEGILRCILLIKPYSPTMKSSVYDLFILRKFSHFKANYYLNTVIATFVFQFLFSSGNCFAPQWMKFFFLFKSSNKAFYTTWKSEESESWIFENQHYLTPFHTARITGDPSRTRVWLQKSIPFKYSNNEIHVVKMYRWMTN